MVKKQKQTKQPPAHTDTEEQDLKNYMHSRFVIIMLFVVGMMCALFAMVFYLQVVDAKHLIKEANDRSLRTVDVPYTRGKILDRNGRVLSVSVQMHSILIDPREYFDTKMRRSKQQWRILAQETGSSASKIEKSVNEFIKSHEKYDTSVLLDPRKDGYWTLLSKVTGLDKTLLINNVRNAPQSRFVQKDNEVARLETEKLTALAKAIEMPYAELIKKLREKASERYLELSKHEPEAISKYIRELKITGLVLRSTSRRFYPMSEEISQLIGFTNTDEKKDNAEVGAEGLERSFDQMLIGKKGKQIYRKDARGNVVENLLNEKQTPPNDVILSIDQDLQSMVYREIKKAVDENKAESGTAVLVDVQTGEILAMANAPSFNPNNRSNIKPEYIRNRAITDTFEPGSTVKPLVVLTALQNGVTYKDEVIDTRPFVVNGHTITDVAPRSSLNLTGILQNSSNVGVSHLTLRMPHTAVIDTYSKVGFGKDTGLALGEQRGSNGDRKHWSKIEQATLAYGYGLNVTPLQLARAYATLGSFGIYRPLSITKVDPPVIGERVLPEKITREVVHMMESVAQKGAGGQLAAVDGYRVAIKTGTARKLENRKYVEKYIAYTAGLAPASDPRFALVVLINEPTAGKYYGGAVSAPLFSSIMGYTLRERNIKPDNLGQEQ